MRSSSYFAILHERSHAWRKRMKRAVAAFLFGALLVGCSGGTPALTRSTTSVASPTATAPYCIIEERSYPYDSPPPFAETPFVSDPDPANGGARYSGGIIYSYVTGGFVTTPGLFIRNIGSQSFHV